MALGIIAARWGGRVWASSHWIQPQYDPPNVPTLPVDHGSPAAHSTVS